ncbi:hypothetical protein [Nitratireductor sp. StC3]|uniref:hypothetical protein n=1 Tax=Nitratireductor sp. StC3 TaxID=2126741 RepID=UPI001304D773|nr:hypothetical protein [Nitratireductor sp. StC3]
MSQQRGERSVMGRAPGLRCEVGSEQQRDVLGQRHEAVASGKCRRLQRVDGFEFAVARAEPQREIVAGFVGEGLQEESAQRRSGRRW